jgi:predicted amidophosphoribosyltransferase
VLSRHTPRRRIRFVLAGLTTLFAPPLCIACGADAGRAAPLCRDCRGRMRPLTAASTDAAASSSARAASSSPWAAFAYEGPAGAMIRALKFGGRIAIADAMAAQMAAHAPPELLSCDVIPVPVHPSHRRRRGLDHTAALGRALARRTRLDYLECLARGGDPLPQVGRGRRARMRGPAGSIVVASGLDPPERALLVDDVVTTGATLAACATALRAAGCQQIAAIAYARTTAR